MNNPLYYTDPSGHWVCESGNDCSVAPIQYLINFLPISEPAWGQGFGANTFAEDHPDLYKYTSGLHGGIDVAGEAGTPVESISNGTVLEINIVSGDAEPNVVVVDGIHRYTYGHVYAAENIYVGMNVSPGTQLGTLEDQGSNSHLHFVFQYSDDRQRVYNPLEYMDPVLVAEVNWGPYPDGEGLHSMTSFEYYGPNYFADTNRAAIGIVRPSRLSPRSPYANLPI